MGGDDRPDALHAEEIVLARRGKRVDAPEMARERLGGVLADVPDAERVHEARQWHVTARGDRLDQLGRGALGESLERQQLLGGDPEQVRRLADIAEVEQLIDDRRPEALDVHGAAGGEMQEQLAALGRAQRIEAAPHHLALLADEE